MLLAYLNITNKMLLPVWKINQPYARVSQPYATLTLASALHEMFGVQLYKKKKTNARALLSRILSTLNLDWLQHARSVWISIIEHRVAWLFSTDHFKNLQVANTYIPFSATEEMTFYLIVLLCNIFWHKSITHICDFSHFYRSCWTTSRFHCVYWSGFNLILVGGQVVYIRAHNNQEYHTPVYSFTYQLRNTALLLRVFGCVREHK